MSKVQSSLRKNAEIVEEALLEKTGLEGMNSLAMIELIKGQDCSNGGRGWPVAMRDRIAFPNSSECRITDANVAVTFLWTMRDAVLPKLETENLALAANFYTPSGLAAMVRNVLSNPFIRYLIIFGEENAAKESTVPALTSADAIKTFFAKGIDENRRVPGFESAAYFDKHIPTELILKVRENLELIDLNKIMPNTTLDERIAEANRLIASLPKKPPFLEKPLTFDYEKAADSLPYEGGPLIASGSTIPATWIEIMHLIYRHGKPNLMNANTDRWVKEVNNLVAVIHDPQNADLSLNPFLTPLSLEKIRAYQEEILSSFLPPGKAYTYGNKLRAYRFEAPEGVRKLVNSTEFKDFEFGRGSHLEKNVAYGVGFCEIDQLQDIIDVLKRDPYSKACVAITWHPAEELMRKHKSSPCLVFLQAILHDEKLNLTVFFRSHDMVQGWPENAYGCAAIQKTIADAIGIEPGIITIISGSAQIYNTYYRQVEEMLAKYRKPKQITSDPRGNYLIQVNKGKIIAVHIHPETQAELDRIEGTSAKEVSEAIAERSQINTAHALYLGRELAKAEEALNKNKEYVQN
ncbi:DUF4346 domain-containing protein [Candidatus Micrarchaeota archaeon]|nr:DUF4346 domain-containing protein [Candidatus Micrarchaeota archaeon]